MGVAEILRKAGHPVTLIDMILAGQQFIITGNKKFIAEEFSGTILGIQTSKTNIKDYSKNQVKRDREKIIKSIESLPKGASSKYYFMVKLIAGRLIKLFLVIKFKKVQNLEVKLELHLLLLLLHNKNKLP